MSLEGKYGKIRSKQETRNLARLPPLVMRPFCGLVAMDCYWNMWAAKAKHESENGNREYPRNMPSPIYIKENLQKSSWSNDGVTRFNELMEEVEQDQNSAEGKQFKIDFQLEMAGSSGNRGKKRKASSKMVQPRNDLSSDDDYDSRDEHEP
jgi:hypothetical protein